MDTKTKDEILTVVARALHYSEIKDIKKRNFTFKNESSEDFDKIPEKSRKLFYDSAATFIESVKEQGGRLSIKINEETLQ